MPVSVEGLSDGYARRHGGGGIAELALHDVSLPVGLAEQRENFRAFVDDDCQYGAQLDADVDAGGHVTRKSHPVP